MRDMQETYEEAIEQAIAQCGGTPQGAIKALIIANEYLEAQLRTLQTAMRNNYSPMADAH